MTTTQTGESVRESIDEAIRTYKREVEKMNEKVEKLERNYIYAFVGGSADMILFAIIEGSVEALYAATIVVMLILCWAIYIVYTGRFSDL